MLERYSVITVIFRVSGDPYKQLPTTGPSGSDVLIAMLMESNLHMEIAA